MEFIICNEKGEEVTLLTDSRYIDMEIGDSNSFSIEISKDYQKRWGIDSGWWIGCPGKEYGGIINKVVSSDNVITLSGSTWRGMLTKKILQPPSGEDYLSVSGDADSIINNVICSEFSGIFVCDTLSNVQYSGYKFDRYVNSLAGIEKMLFSKNLKLSIEYDSGEPNGKSFVRIKSTPIHDFSDEIEYSKDGTLSYIYFSFEKFTGGINHLICLGKGELKDRLVLHLYADENGDIGTEQHFFGADEREATYDYSSAGSEEDLRKNGTEKFKELLSYKSMDMDLFNESLAGLRGINDDISIGDIVGGRDFDTGIYLSKQITRKIVQVKDGRESIEYSVGKPVLNRSTANAPVEESNPLDKLIKVTADETGLSIGKDAELSDILDIGLDTKFNNDVYGTVMGVGYLPDIPSNVDFNDYVMPGAYNVKSNAIAETISNMPTQTAGRLKVESANGRSISETLTKTWVYLLQTYYTIEGIKYTRYIISKETAGVWTYGSWRKHLTNGDIGDQIVSIGNSGIWQYRKWASGIAECWGIYHVKATCTSAWGSLYETSVMQLPSFPFSFTDTPNGSYTWRTLSGAAFIEYVNPTTTSGGSLALSRPTTSSSLEGYVSMYVIGKWK